MVVPEKFFEVEFNKAMAFGYRTEDVDEFVTKAIEIIKALQAENQELTEKLGVLAQSLEKYREDEESLRSALIGAQKLGDSILKDSRSKAEVILRDATTNADHIIEEAHARLEREKAEFERLKAEVATFREGLFDLYKSHIDQISKLPHKDKPAAQHIPAQKVPKPIEPPMPEPEPELELEPEPIPAPPPRKVPEPPVPQLEEEPELMEEEYVPAPPPEPPVKRAPAKRPALRLELDDDEDEDDEIESDDEILSRFSNRAGNRRSFRPLPPEDDDYVEEEDEEDDDLRPISRAVFSSKFGEMRFGEGFSLTQDDRERERDRDRSAGGRASGRRSR